MALDLSPSQIEGARIEEIYIETAVIHHRVSDCRYVDRVYTVPRPRGSTYRDVEPGLHEPGAVGCLGPKVPSG